MGDGDETATIEALSRQFTEALRSRDSAAVAGMFTNDAVICPPNSNIITGKGNVAQFWERNRRIQGLSFDSVSVKPLGENALRAVGIMSLQLASANSGPQAAAGRGQAIKAKYVLIWQKVDGAWKIDSGIWNRIGPAQTRGLPAPSAIRAGGFGPGGGPRGAGGGGIGPGNRGGLGPGGRPRGAGLGPGGGPRGGGPRGPGGGGGGGGPAGV